jgi:protein-tyrosine phosphatase
LFDIHNHVLPRVDDGASSMNEALRMLEQASEQGITHVCCTPHANERATAETDRRFHEALDELKQAAAKHGLPVELGLAAEIMLGIDLQRVLALPFATFNGKGEYFLLEFEREIAYEIVLNVVRSARRWGKRPVIAHVERFSRVVATPDRPRELRAAGAILSMDAGTLSGQFGPMYQKRAWALLNLDVIDIFASDAHNDAEHGFCLKQNAQAARSMLSELRVRELVVDNPRRVWFGEPWPDESANSQTPS